jgi:hypothetical protein
MTLGGILGQKSTFALFVQKKPKNHFFVLFNTKKALFDLF